MEDNYRLKIKIGEHEFEAEGRSEVVQEQFQAFKEMIASTPAKPPAQTQKESTKNGDGAQPITPTPDTPAIDAALSKIMKLENRVISLTVRADSIGDAILLLLYGQKILRQNDLVTGAEIMDGLTATGGMNVLRIDRLLEQLATNGDVIVTGERRGKRYRMTNAGIAKARQLAVDLIAIVA